MSEIKSSIMSSYVNVTLLVKVDYSHNSPDHKPGLYAVQHHDILLFVSLQASGNISHKSIVTRSEENEYQ